MATIKFHDNLFTESKAAQISAFFRRLDGFDRERLLDHSNAFRGQWNIFRPSFLEVLSVAAKKNKREGSTFNIFRVLGVEHDEENTHSRLLADLLNPQGFHGQDVLFLQMFLNDCHRKQNLSLIGKDTFSLPWYVETEKGTQQGRIDIVITCPAARYIVVIENKVRASEQEKQLKRYHDWLETQSHSYTHRSLFFLTPDGRAPTTAAGCPCLCLSYRHDLTTLLKAAMEHISAPHLRAIIGQYLEIIEDMISASEDIREA